MKRRRDLAIELTPLLDVILIMLFLIMSGNSEANEKLRKESENDVKSANEQISELKADVDRLEAENETLASRLDGINAVSDYARVITISYSLGDDGTRSVIIDHEGDWKYVEFDWDSTRYGANTIRSELEELTDTNEPVFISFSYDDRRIFNSDYEMLSSLIISLQSDNVYTRIQEME